MTLGRIAVSVFIILPVRGIINTLLSARFGTQARSFAQLVGTFRRIANVSGPHRRGRDHVKDHSSKSRTPYREDEGDGNNSSSGDENEPVLDSESVAGIASFFKATQAHGSRNMNKKHEKIQHNMQVQFTRRIDTLAFDGKYDIGKLKMATTPLQGKQAGTDRMLMQLAHDLNTVKEAAPLSSAASGAITATPPPKVAGSRRNVIPSKVEVKGYVTELGNAEIRNSRHDP